MEKTYLGDGVFANIRESAISPRVSIELTTENGSGVDNVIVLEPEVYLALVLFARTIGWEVIWRITNDEVTFTPEYNPAPVPPEDDF